MPNRIIKESICESFGLSKCSIFSRDLFERLITYADDYGRFNADTQIMLARLYPREMDCVTQEDIVNSLIELSGVGKISFYTSNPRKTVYGCFPNWSLHQRVRDSKAKCPDPDDTTVNDWYLRRFIPLDLKVEIIERDGFKCQLCGKFITSDRNAKRLAKHGCGMYHIDHIVPVSQGGRATLENLRLTCPSCNLKRKRAYSFDEILEFTKCDNTEVRGGSPQLAATRCESRPESNPIQSESNTCTEQAGPASVPEEPPVILLPLNDGTDYAVSREQCQKWAGLYPAVDVIQQLRNMKGWLDANPRKRKTRAGVNRFVNGWLAKDQNRGGTPGYVPDATPDHPNEPPPPPPTPEEDNPVLLNDNTNLEDLYW